MGNLWPNCTIAFVQSDGPYTNCFATMYINYTRDTSRKFINKKSYNTYINKLLTRQIDIKYQNKSKFLIDSMHIVSFWPPTMSFDFNLYLMNVDNQ